MIDFRIKELQRFIMFNSKPRHEADNETQDATIDEEKKTSN